jgi:manganese/iron transport system ATP-binding protein
MMEAIHFHQVNVWYRHEHVLKNVSLSLEEGECTAVLGPNGSGKTTLLRAILGTVGIASGTITILGTMLNDKNARRIRTEIGYVPQNLAIDSHFPISVREAVATGCYGKVGLFRKLAATDEQMIEQAMNLTGIRHLAHKPIGHLSGGELQKVLLARAIAQRPRILLLDEPTSHLDMAAQFEILKVIESIYNEQKITIIMVTHIFTHIPATVRKALLMKEGMILAQGSRNEIMQENLLSKAYNCPVEYLVHQYAGDG